MEEFQLRFVLGMLAYTIQKDVSPERLCKLAGLDWEEVKAGKTPLTAKQVNDLWLNASHLTKDPLFGLHFGESLQLAALGIVGQIIQNSRTVGEALTHAAEFIHLLTDLFDMDVTQTGRTFSVQFVANEDRVKAYPFLYRQLADLATVFVLHELDGLLLEKMTPLTVTLPYVSPDYQEYERVLRCRSVNEGDTYALVFDGRYRDVPILTANYELQQLLLQKASAMSNSLEAGQSLKERICTFLLANAYLGIPTLDGIAANFNTSSRSLQRRLQEEGVTYQQLADSIRKSLALHYLESGKYPIKEISYILGYNEISAFTRAFKRWTGYSPINYTR
ncbi:AraC family transcriptional regulator [Spirosoma fluminis]